MSKSPDLSAKQSKFVQEYLIDGNGAAAAVRAGYGSGGAKVAASRLLTKDNVQKALQARHNADATRLCLAREDVLAGLLEAVAQAKLQGNPTALISGWREIGKMMGYFAPEQLKVELSPSCTAELNRFERMTDAELQAVIASGSAENKRHADIENH